MSTIIKEYSPKAKMAALRTARYARTLKYISMLFEEAKKDVPNLKPEDCEIVIYGGQRHRNTMGLEFESEANPNNYTETILEEIF